ncbi:amino acid adenylation domain-containing protein [Aquabacterium sp.]|uniref:amino acid adenylation domain-containing protein n=1 Tax=Aquabacterium sp. TaxID=1872578 RepID=UPI0024895C84|nr:amino acid adenylation domain-containing protein [Aquabacterium sp.]MDI1261536.1 amino acid adenylation domain-containing protein [Aquabacterium sp.]
MAPEQTKPLTQAQRGIWMGQQMSPDTPSYWTAETLLLKGDLRLEFFQRAVDHVLRHAQTLHMVGVDAASAAYPAMPLAEGSCRPRLQTLEQGPGQNPTWPDVSAQLCARGPTAAPTVGESLWRQVFVPVAEDQYAWCFWAHHLVLDGYGYALLQAAVAQSYVSLHRGQALPDLSHWTLDEVIAEDTAYQASPRRQQSAGFWAHRLSGVAANTLAQWPSSQPLPTAHSVRRAQHKVAADDVKAWRQAALHQNQDWITWLAAGAAKALTNLMGTQQVTLGWPVMNRLGSCALSVPCMHMNIVPLALQCTAHDQVAQLATQLAKHLRDIRPHQRYRYEHMRQEQRRLGERGRIFGPVLNLMPFERVPDMPALAVSTHTLAAGPVEDLVINLSWHDPEMALHISVEGNPFLYEQAKLAELVCELQAVWRAGALERADDTVPQHVLTGPALTCPMPPPLAGSAVLAQLAAHAQGRGDHVAVQCPRQQLSYASLWHQAAAHANALSAKLPERDARVLIVLPRHTQTLALILGAWMAGACYIPLDPATPPARRQLIVDDARPHLIVTHADLAPQFSGDWPVWTPDLETPLTAPGTALPSLDQLHGKLHGMARAPSDTAYVIYTSGSTGRPNGVMISHAALAHFLAAATQTYGMQPNDRMLQFAPLHFDASVEELFLPLMSGATVVMRDDAVLESPAHLLRHAGLNGLTVLDLPTAYWHELARALADDQVLRSMWPACIRLVIIGGEAAQLPHVLSWREHMPKDVVLLNTYGPTETTVICSTAVLSGPQAVDISEGIPIGGALPGLRFLLSEPRPLNTANSAGLGAQCWHLSVEGPTLANGYLGNPALSADKFREHQYRTGDLVSIDASGQLIYQGRIDDELKISGYRIDPCEIESALLSHDDIQAASVQAHALDGGQKQLLAFYVLRSANSPALNQAQLREHLGKRLPAPAIPTHFLALSRLPFNHNNKVDRHALKAQMAEHLARAQQAPAQRACTELEAMIAATWTPLLGGVPLQPDSDFFALGGASLQAIQACSRLATHLGREVPVSMLFAHPTVAAFAQALSQPVAHHPPNLGSGQELQPLLCIQRAASHTAPLLLCVHPAEGLSWCYFGLCRHLLGIEIWGIQSPGITGHRPETFHDLIQHYVALVRQIRPHGPYALLGWSSGGGIAHAMASMLQSEGESVSLLAMMDSYPASIWHDKPEAGEKDALEALLDVIGASAQTQDGKALSADEMRQLLRRPGSPLALMDQRTHQRLIDNALHGMGLYRTADHAPVSGPLLYFRASIRGPRAPLEHGWRDLVKGRIDIVNIDSDHNGMSQPKPLSQIGTALAKRLSAANSLGNDKKDLMHAAL